MSIKLIAIDMDGTLLNHENKISEENIKAIQKATEKGVHVAICTGRMFPSANEYANLVGIKVPIICSNGAYIREKDVDKVIYKDSLGKENIEIIFNILNSYSLKGQLFFNTPDSICTMISYDEDKIYRQFIATFPKNTEKPKLIYNISKKEIINISDNILKAVYFCEDTDEISYLKEKFIDINLFEVTSSLSKNIELNTKGINKGHGVAELAKILGITNKDEIMCIGDSSNDKSMIEYAGLGIAMGNANNEIKSIAQYITDTNDNFGVAKAIQKFILNNNTNI